MSESKKDKRNENLKPGVNAILHPDQDNPGPTDMIEDALGDIVDNIAHPNKNTKNDQNDKNKS
ncbi:MULTISPECIES: hypothetical protein [unclassified Paenibacillus]|uniref:hypothetical protein n=1 Tax=unclassified Paenibacillus TaxID=185978 RepID=UPI000FE1DD0A|nr:MULTISPECIES: hypothetical protein [unclassified Paenibacillus]MCM3172652.1 hypothetical protein [Paenibacillus sp. MER 99-2]